MVSGRIVGMVSANAHSAWNTNFRVAVVHSFYSSRQPSGENMVVEQQVDALRRAGYSVEVFAQRTDERETLGLYPLGAALTVATGRGPKPDLTDYAPDIIHLHNTFPNYGKHWLKDTPAPVVSTLHNYRPMCAAGTFYRDGKICTECPDGKSSLPAVKYGCYRNRAAAVPVALGQRFADDPVLKHSAALVALSDSMRSRYEAYGVEPGKLRVLPNFLPAPLDEGPGEGGDYWLYAGRLSDEKGVLPLIRDWPADRKLLIAGQGDLDADVRSAAAGKNIVMLGPVERPQLMSLMREAVGVVFPSKCLEGFPLVYLEALAAGTPVLSWEPTVVASLVSEDGTGMVGGASVSDSVAAADRSFPELRSRCRSIFESKYGEVEWVSRLRSIYDGALSTSLVR